MGGLIYRHICAKQGGRVDGGDFEECVDRGDALVVALALIVAVQNE